MKNSCFFITKVLFIISLIISCLLFNGCVEFLEADGIGGLADTRLIAEDAALLDDATLTINGEGRLVAANEASFNKLLGKIELKRAPGKNPELFIKGQKEPFGEVISKESKLKLLRYNKEFGLSNSIFSVEGETVYVRATAEEIPNNTVAVVHHNDLVVTLSEDHGWYQVKIIKDSKVIYGWIYGAAIAPLVLSNKEKSDCETEVTGNYSFKNNTNRNFTVFLYDIQIPEERVMNGIGVPTVASVTLQPMETQTLYNIKAGVYRYRIREPRQQRIATANTRPIEFDGQIKVETCQKLEYTIHLR